MFLRLLKVEGKRFCCVSVTLSNVWAMTKRSMCLIVTTRTTFESSYLGEYLVCLHFSDLSFRFCRPGVKGQDHVASRACEHVLWNIVGISTPAFKIIHFSSRLLFSCWSASFLLCFPTCGKTEGRQKYESTGEWISEKASSASYRRNTTVAESSSQVNQS